MEWRNSEALGSMSDRLLAGGFTAYEAHNLEINIGIYREEHNEWTCGETDWIFLPNILRCASQNARSGSRAVPAEWGSACRDVRNCPRYHW